MKKAAIIVLMILMISQISFQGIRAEIQDPGKISKKNDNDKEIIIGKDFLKIRENDSLVNIRIKNRGLTILESLEGNDIKLEKYTEDDELSENDKQYENYEQYQENENWNNEDNDRRENRRSRFKGNWAGVEFGFNNYTTSSDNMVIPEAIDYMTLHSGKSHNFNINFAQLSLGITRHIGFVTGLGVNMNNYKFDGNNNIIKGANGVIEELVPGSVLEKSKLATVYLTVPFLLEFQLPVNNNHLNVSAGPIGAVKIASHSKMVFEDKQKVKSNSDFNLNMLRYGATARVGFSNLQIYGTYYMTPLFQTGKGPLGYNLYPFEIGVAFTFNN